MEKLERAGKNHYATLGLDRRCTTAQIRAAYRLLAKQFHPDANHSSREAVARTQELNAAHEILSNARLRAAYDRELDAEEKKSAEKTRAGKIERNISQDINLPLEDFFRGTKREVRLNDPANPNGAEIYELIVPPETAPGTRFKIPREEPFADGFVQLRVQPLPHFRFKTRGPDLRCDLKINSRRAVQGGVEMIRGISGAAVQIKIPRGISRGEIICVSGEGLPRPRGGRGDLLVRIIYRVEVRVTRPAK